MKSNKILAITAMAGLMLTSCNNDALDSVELNGNYPNDGLVRISTDINAQQTRADKSPYQGTNLSLSVDYGADNKYTASNVEWTNSPANWTPASQMLWQNATTTAGVYAFAPYQGEVADIEAIPFSVQANQSTGLTNSDLLGYVNNTFVPGNNLNTENAININFTHKLSKVIVNLTYGDQWTEAERPTVEALTIENTSPTVNYNAITGKLNDNGGMPPARSNNSISIITHQITENTSYEAVIVPQTMLQGTKLVKIVLSSGAHYAYTTSGQTFNSNTQYTINLRIGKDKVTLASPVTVNAWGEPEDMGSGDTEAMLPYYKISLDQFSAAEANRYNEWRVSGDGPILNDSEFNKAIKARTEPLTLTMPNLTTVGAGGFYQCLALVSIELPNVTSIASGAFNGCVNLVSLELPKLESPIESSMFLNCNKLISINLPEVTEIGDQSFANLTNLQNVSLPKATTIGNAAFTSCSKLEEAFLPLVDKINDNAFNNCNSLTAIHLPKATTIGNTSFSACSNLASIELPKSTTIGNAAFTSCSKLEEISLPEATTIGQSIFGGTRMLVHISMPKVADLNGNTFTGLDKLVSIDLSSATNIGAYGFSGCDSLTEIHLGANGAITIDPNAFNSIDTSNITLYLNSNETISNNQWHDWTFKEIIQ